MAKGDLEYQYYAHLARRIREGDPDAFAELYDSTYDDLYRYVYYLVKDRNAVEDVLQEIYISVYRNVGGLKTDRVVLPWIKQIAYHESCDYLRRVRNSKERPYDLADDRLLTGLAAVETEEDCFRPVFDRDLSRQLRLELEKLPVRERQAFLLRYEHELKLEELADFMDVSLASVKRYIQRAQLALKKSFSHLKEKV